MEKLLSALVVAGIFFDPVTIFAGGGGIACQIFVFRAAEKVWKQTPKLPTIPQPLLLCAYPGLVPVPKMRIARHTMARLQAGPHEFLLRQYRRCRVRQRDEPGELSPVDA